MSERWPEESHRRPEAIAGTFSIHNPGPASLVFCGGGSEPLFTIKPDGEIVRGPAFTTEDEASLRFWDIIQKSFPSLIKS